MILPPTFAKEENTIYAIIETPRGSRNKYDYHQQNDFFQLKKVLPSGISFPFDFGFIPHTLADDGDPINVLVIMDCIAFPGCVVQSRVIGVIEAQKKRKIKNLYATIELYRLQLHH